MTGDDNINPSLLIFYDYFYPGYKAGGPVQSLSNLITCLQKKYTVSVITAAFDLHSNKNYPNININEWNRINLPDSSTAIKIFYNQKGNLTRKKILRIISETKPQFIYLNGIFSYHFFLLPLLAINKLKYSAKVIICPRGMLQQGALSGGLLKKTLYLKFLKTSGLLKNVQWHATSQAEKEDIIKVFGSKQSVKVAHNVPKKPLVNTKQTCKQTGSLRLVYLSLIAEKKNLLLVLEMMLGINGATLDIYGPVKDITYWKKCKKVIDRNPGKFKYRGEIIPDKVQETFEQYDASILLTKGENFGHALYESLSAGRPVITSYFTPWIKLEQQKAGWNIDISSGGNGVQLLKNLCKTPQDKFTEYCYGAHDLAVKYYSGLNQLEQYTKLFSS